MKLVTVNRVSKYRWQTDSDDIERPLVQRSRSATGTEKYRERGSS